MTDNEILRLMRDDPPRGQRALFDKYYNYVYAIVSRLISGFGTSSDMEECTADVFAAAMMKLEPREDTALKSFIGTAARNAAISTRRRLASKTGLDCREGDEELSALADSENSDRQTGAFIHAFRGRAIQDDSARHAQKLRNQHRTYASPSARSAFF